MKIIDLLKSDKVTVSFEVFRPSQKPIMNQFIMLQ